MVKTIPVAIMIACLLLMSLSPLSFASPGLQEVEPMVDSDGPTMDVPSVGPYDVGPAEGRFIENLGQWGDHVRFVAKGSIGDIAFQDNGVMYMLRGAEGVQAVEVSFHGADDARIMGIGQTGAMYNYLVGNDPDGWVTGAREFRALVYRDVWPGIDVHYRFSGAGFKYDVIVGAEADPSDIRFDVAGHAGIDADDDRLSILLPGGRALQDVDLVAWYGDGEAVDASFLQVDNGYGFSVDKEPGRTLVIDPLVITRSTFLGGTYTDTCEDIAMDGQGNVFVAGTTISTDYPVTPGAYNEDYLAEDLVVTKLDRDLSQVIWSTYIGGSAEDKMNGLALDTDGNVHVLGTTRSGDFPISDGALQSTQGGPYSDDLVVLKLTPDGASLVYSTYIGGSWAELPGDIQAHDGRAYVAGMTESADFPFGNITGGRYAGAAFLMVISKDGTRLDAFQSWKVTRMVEPASMVVSDDGTVTLTGRTSSPDLPTTPGAYIENATWPMSTFVIQCDPWTNETSLCTYFGQTGVYGSEVALDGEGNIYLAGLAYSFGQGLPLTEGAWCTTFKGNRDEFVAKMDANGSRVIYCTLVGGDSYDFAGDLEATADGKAVFVGWSWQAEGYNTTGNAHDDENEGSHEGFVLVLDETGADAVQSTYLGGQFGEYVTAVEITSENTLMLAGYTESKGFPVTEGAYQEELAGDRDIFVTELAVLSPPSVPRNLTALGGEGHITLNWQPPLDDRGYPIVNYTVHRETDEGELELIRVVGPGTTYVDLDVEYGEYYVYRVAAFNGKGMSLKSNKATARSITVPDAPANLTGTVNDDHIKLEWVAPTFTGGLELGEYNVYKVIEGGEMELIAKVHPYLESFVDPQVADRLTYTYVLAATNGYGESRDNPSVTLRMTGVPTPPRSLAYTYGDQYIELSWEEPEDVFDLPVARYYVYRTTGNEPSGLVGVARSPSLALRDKAVEVGVTYTYYVVAENAKGMSDPSKELEAMTMVAPDPPQDVEAVANERFVRITWSPPEADGASPVTSYRIYLGGMDDSDVLLGDVNVVGVEEPRLVFLHEQPYDGMSRAYFVTALNAEGESDPSGAVWTLLYKVCTPPLSLEADWGDSKVVLTWSLPEDDGGAPVLSFKLFRKVATSDTFIELETLPASNLRFVDDEAINGVEYTYWMTASNLAGESEPSAEVTVMPAGPPSAPGDVIVEGHNGSVTVRWEAPDWNGGLPVLGYRVYGISEGSTTELLSDLGSDDFEFVQGSLVNGMVYLYALRAYSEVGEGEMSQVVEGRPVGAPSAPQALIAVWMDGMVYVTWSSPMDDGGAQIGGYRLSREDWNTTEWTNVPALGMMYSDEEVEYNETYTYRVFAYNDVGGSPIVNITITVPSKEAASEDDPVKMWPWVLLAAASALLVLAIVFHGRSRRPGYGPDEGDMTEGSEVPEEPNVLEDVVDVEDTGDVDDLVISEAGDPSVDDVEG
jgi:fibronectin type 3 domain-containing protein